MNIDIDVIYLYVLVSILFIILAGIIGNSCAIRDDLKSCLYDKLEQENRELKAAIEKMMEVKNEKEYEDDEI